MKIRNGFVSNSSSSSYIIIGNKISFNDIKLEDIEHKENYVLGKDLCKGVDFFPLTKDIFNEMHKNTSCLSSSYEMSFFEVYHKIYFEEFDIHKMKKDELPEEFEIFVIEKDDHSTETKEDFIGNYIDEN